MNAGTPWTGDAPSPSPPPPSVPPPSVDPPCPPAPASSPTRRLRHVDHHRQDPLSTPLFAVTVQHYSPSQCSLRLLATRAGREGALRNPCGTAHLHRRCIHQRANASSAKPAHSSRGLRRSITDTGGRKRRAKGWGSYCARAWGEASVRAPRGSQARPSASAMNSCAPPPPAGSARRRWWWVSSHAPAYAYIPPHRVYTHSTPPIPTAIFRRAPPPTLL